MRKNRKKAKDVIRRTVSVPTELAVRARARAAARQQSFADYIRCLIAKDVAAAAVAHTGGKKRD